MKILGFGGPGFLHDPAAAIVIDGKVAAAAEEVFIDAIVGDIDDLLESPILFAEESTNSGDMDGKIYDSFTWTFYKFATVKGYVTVRWYGTSNGYYGEGVSFAECM